MGKTIAFDPDDESMPRPRYSAAELARREAGWRDTIGRHGRRDGSVNDVYRLSLNHDHDGRQVSPDERQRWEDSQGIVSPDDPTTDG